MSKESAMNMLNGVATIPSEQPTTSATAPVVQAPQTSGELKELDSTRFKHLADKESQLQRDREAFKKEREMFEKERTPLVEAHKRVTEFDSLKAKDKMAALKYAGFSDTDIFEIMANVSPDNQTPEEKAAKAAQDVISKFQTDEAKKASDAQAKLNQDTLTTFRNDINKFISSDPDKYELCAYNGEVARELVEETVVAILNDTKELIDISEAVGMVEQYYEDQYKSMSNLKRFKAKTEVPPVPAKEEPLKPQVSPRPSRPASPTLSTKTVATIASTTVPKHETRSEKRNRLIEKLGQLGKQG